MHYGKTFDLSRDDGEYPIRLVSPDPRLTKKKRTAFSYNIIATPKLWFIPALSWDLLERGPGQVREHEVGRLRDALQGFNGGADDLARGLAEESKGQEGRGRDAPTDLPHSTRPAAHDQ